MNENRNDYELLFLLKETNERLMTMISWCEKLQPVKLGDKIGELIDLTDDEEIRLTKLFRVDDEMVDEDQTGRSICKDLRKVIRHLEEKLNKKTEK
tara:strand:+ start:317 stop:604 length:288 start_codon:yes stop_codon:yes gene_type:complete